MSAHPPYAVLPFAILLLSIALVPLAFGHFWERNRNKAIMVGLVALPAAIYLAGHDARLLEHAALEYLSFIALLASLCVIAGGVVVRGDLPDRTWVNVSLLGAGAVLANLIGHDRGLDALDPS